jgi:hypothetical protein
MGNDKRAYWPNILLDQLLDRRKVNPHRMLLHKAANNGLACNQNPLDSL